MGSRLLPLALAAGALFADAVGFHRGASYLVLLAVVAAAAAAFVATADVLNGKPARLRAVGAAGALAFLLLGAVARVTAPIGASVPTIAVSSLVAVLAVYSLPLVGWVLEPLRPKRREPRVLRETGRRTDAGAAEAA